MGNSISDIFSQTLEIFNPFNYLSSTDIIEGIVVIVAIAVVYKLLNGATDGLVGFIF
jgi:hypothetical protein